jgi:hypothetical protein
MEERRTDEQVRRAPGHEEAVQLRRREQQRSSEGVAGPGNAPGHKPPRAAPTAINRQKTTLVTGIASRNIARIAANILTSRPKPCSVGFAAYRCFIEGKTMQEVDAIDIELLDLGDAATETRQWYLWPIWYDSIFQLGQKEG